jgi:hypothetical protein
MIDLLPGTNTTEIKLIQVLGALFCLWNHHPLTIKRTCLFVLLRLMSGSNLSDYQDNVQSRVKLLNHLWKVGIVENF